MASIELRVSIYPTVWCVVLKNSGLDRGMEVIDSIWATETLALAATHLANRRDEDKNMKWECVETPVGNEMKG